MIKPGIVEVSAEWKMVIEILQAAILDKRLLQFIFKSKDRNEAQRIIRPYMIIPRGNILELVGTPVTELKNPIETRQARHYAISQLEQRLKLNQLKVLARRLMIRVFQER